MRCMIVAMAMGLVLPCLALGQAQEGAVAGTGSVVILRQPDVLRMQIELTAEGKTLKEAMAKLAERRSAAKQKLATLGAIESSIRFEDPTAGSSGNARRQMERMVRSRLAGKKPGAAQTPPVRVSAVLKAEWPLKAKDGDEMLVVASELQEKIKAADLADVKTASLAEQEEREEAGSSDMPGSEEGRPAGEPIFLFVGRISPEERAKGMADAFAKAKQDAANLAKAAGVELGALKHVSGRGGPEFDGDDYNAWGGSSYGRYAYNLMQRSQSEDSPEAIGMNPGAVKIRVMVSATFAVK